MTPQTHRFTLGRFTCVVILGTQRQITDLGDYLPDASPEEVARVIQARGIATIESCYNLFYVATGDHRVLVDTGRESAPIVAGLAAEGIAPGEIDTVILTHFHGDHIGGLLDAEGRATFPDARYVAPQIEWDLWDGRGPEAEASARARAELMQQNLMLVTDGQAVLPGITAVGLPGHTPGMMGILVESEGAGLLLLADAIQILPQLANPAWGSKHDRDRPRAGQTRQAILARAAGENLLLLPFHFPFPGVGRVAVADAGFTWEPL